jgi:glycerol-3-phosphate acyltransferase PlsX
VPVRIAVDLLGGDDAPAVVVAGARAALLADPDLTLLLVGPPDAIGDLAGHERVVVQPAYDRVLMTEHPVRAVRAKRDATIRIAARAVRDGAADALVSAGSTGAAMAAAKFALGSLPGITRFPVAVTVPSPAGPVVVADAGANVDCAPALLVQFALCAAALATVQHGVDQPRVGLLNIGSEPGKGDALRQEAYDLLTEAPVRFVGNVEPAAVAAGGVADVVVTDGFTGNVLLKSLEAGSPQRAEAGAGFALGVDGVVVVGHGAATARAISSYVAAAAAAVRGGLVPRLAQVMAGLVEHRRQLAGLA